jgi:hypothetical protein
MTRSGDAGHLPRSFRQSPACPRAERRAPNADGCCSECPPCTLATGGKGRVTRTGDAPVFLARHDLPVPRCESAPRPPPPDDDAPQTTEQEILNLVSARWLVSRPGEPAEEIEPPGRRHDACRLGSIYARRFRFAADSDSPGVAVVGRPLLLERDLSIYLALFELRAGDRAMPDPCSRAGVGGPVGRIGCQLSFDPLLRHRCSSSSCRVPIVKTIFLLVGIEVENYRHCYPPSRDCNGLPHASN